MSESTVARLRELLSDADGAHYLTDPQVQRLVFAAAAALPALLAVVERVAAVEPLDAGLRCLFCGWRSDHAPDCIYPAARRACGMEDAE